MDIPLWVRTIRPTWTGSKAYEMSPNSQIIAVLGSLSVGKGTQRALLQTKCRCTHISMEDLLRAEAAGTDSPYRDIITENMKQGRVGPK